MQNATCDDALHGSGCDNAPIPRFHVRRLQRGEAVVYRDRGIADHDYVRIWNDVGDFVARAKLTGAIRPQQVHIYHAWEPYQFCAGSSEDVSPSPIKVTQLVGDYGHLHWAAEMYAPNQNDRGTRVDVSKV